MVAVNPTTETPVTTTLRLPDACSDEPCQNGGTCTVVALDYECKCIGATGKNCEEGEHSDHMYTFNCMSFYVLLHIKSQIII